MAAGGFIHVSLLFRALLRTNQNTYSTRIKFSFHLYPTQALDYKTSSKACSFVLFPKMLFTRLWPMHCFWEEPLIRTSTYASPRKAGLSLVYVCSPFLCLSLPSRCNLLTSFTSNMLLNQFDQLQPLNRTQQDHRICETKRRFNIINCNYLQNTQIYRIKLKRIWVSFWVSKGYSNLQKTLIYRTLAKLPMLTQNRPKYLEWNLA